MGAGAVAVYRSEVELSIPMQEQAFAAFVEANRERAVRLAFRLLGGDRAAAEDVAQNALLRAHGGLARFRGDATLDTWFYRILLREIQRHRRWRAVRRLWSGDAARAPEPVDERAPGDPLLRRRIVDALERLSDAQRQAFVLVHLEGVSIADAAAVMGRATGTVKSHLHRALESLRRDLAGARDDDAKPTERTEESGESLP
jgi:RNA polymerase sigma-70 factor (ECF subfamily)